jgi:ribonuclease P protein component
VKRRFRLRRESDFQQVVKGRRVYAGVAVVAFARPSAAGEWRIGVAVSRQLKGSVRRNRARRRLREAARAMLLGHDSELAGLGISYDVVLIARPAALTLPALDLEREAAAVGDRLKGSDRGHGPAQR